MTSTLHRPFGSLTGQIGPVSLEPAAAGWTHAGLDVITLWSGMAIELRGRGRELCLLPLSARRVSVQVGDETFTLDGRESVFARVSDFLYVGRDTNVRIESDVDGQLAVASSICERRLPPKYGSADDVAVEVRGAGRATRQVSNLMGPEVWDHADKLMCVEVYTPDGNWSSYPPHKHDHSPECEVANEQLYYFRIGAAGTTDYSADGFGMHRTYASDPDGTVGDVDETVAVRDGDVCLVPRGYHGPTGAAPGYDLYSLNVLAGRGGQRSTVCYDDPAHRWIRDTWSAGDLDPRCPLVTAEGKTNNG